MFEMKRAEGLFLLWVSMVFSLIRRTHSLPAQIKELIQEISLVSAAIICSGSRSG